MIWCVLEPDQQDRLLLEHMLAHAVYAKPWSHTLQKLTTPLQGWNTFTCGDEEEEDAADLHHAPAAVIQMETHTKHL